MFGLLVKDTLVGRAGVVFGREEHLDGQAAALRSQLPVQLIGDAATP
ncbi:hypothetical protein [Mycobacterium aquaticum]|nr:hypothetical protein [Mycobacterium aquaticum]